MSVKQIDPVTNDLVRGSSFLRVSGAAEIGQGVDVRLKLLRGEYPWDLALGTKMLELILLRGAPESLIIGELTKRILSQPGMLTVDQIEARRLPGDPDRLSVNWEGTGSTDTLAELLRVQGTTEITSP